MTAFRYVIVGITCLALALPLPAFSPCCCVTGKVASENCCATAETYSRSCCNSSTKKVSVLFSEDAIRHGKSACNCSVGGNTKAALASNSKCQIDIGNASCPIALLDTTPIPFVTLHSSPDRPPISHNQRQAALCV